MLKFSLAVLTFVLNILCLLILLQPLNLYLQHAFNYQISLLAFYFLVNLVQIVTFNKSMLAMEELVKKNKVTNDKDNILISLFLTFFKIIAGLILWFAVYLYFK